MQPQGTYLDEYKIIQTLGDGYHAIVKLGQAPDHTLVAIKKFKKQTANLETLKHELEVMRKLSHPNLVNLIDVRQKALYKKPNGQSYHCFAIILEYVSGGQLFDFIAIAGRFNEVMTRTYFFQLLNAVNYMHERGFAHRDIKPQNIMLTSDYVLKLADFGFSCLLQGKDKSGVLHTKLGTEGYMAPEISTKKYEGTKVDIFACGVILFIMFSGNPPFQRATANDPFYKLIKEKDLQRFWLLHSKRKPLNFYKSDFKKLIEAMLAYNPQQRPTLLEISQFQWMKGQTVSIQSLKNELSQRKQKVDMELQKQRNEKQKRRQEREKAIYKKSQNISRNTDSDLECFVQTFQKQQGSKTQLGTKNHIQNCDIVVQEAQDFVYTTIVTHLSKPIVFKDGEVVVEEYNPTFKREGNKFIVKYVFQNAENKTEMVSMSITISKDHAGNVVITPKKIDGNCIHMRRLKKMLSKEFCYCRVQR